MLVATFWLGVWHDWDWYVLRWLSGQEPPRLSARVVVLDVKDYDRKNPQLDRLTIGAFLHQLVARHQKPAAVLLDFFFEAEDSVSPGPATALLSKALDEAAGASLPVFATISQPEMLQRARGVDWSQLRYLDWANIYDRLGGGIGHTVLNLYDDGLFYQACYPQVPKSDSRGEIVGRFDIKALSYLVAENGEVQPVSGCDPTLMKIIRVGSHQVFVASGVDQISRGRPFPGKFELDNRYVIVASLGQDLGPVVGRSNPELLAWALSDLLASPGTTYYEPIPYGTRLIILIVVFSAITVGAFAGSFLFLRRSRLGTLRIWLPWISAAVAAAIVLGLFAGLEALLLFAGHIQPQVSLVALSVLISASLSGERGRQLIYEQLNQIDLATEEANDYDVFISYAHDELPWVFERVYKPLAEARLPDGRKLRIFFDTSSIRIGTAWQEKISLAIDGSRFIVPVYSEAYFSRPYCRFEVRRAHRKWVEHGEEAACVLPIMRGHPAIDRTVDDIQATSVDDQPDLIERVVAAIVERVGRREPSGATIAGPVVGHATPDTRTSPGVPTG